MVGIRGAASSFGVDEHGVGEDTWRPLLDELSA